MTAQSEYSNNSEEVYYHIYNKGIGNRDIFNEKVDYEVFLTYLQEYLTAPSDTEKAKKAFTIKGRIFRGVPHLPKNYFDKVELLAYSLSANHFHLVLGEKTQGVVEKLLRSLSTRYAMYFNKKYKRNGPLFQGPYKSVAINDSTKLLYLTHFLYSLPHETASAFSSYPEYLGNRQSQWIKPQAVLNSFDSLKDTLFQRVGIYKDFIEKYKLNESEYRQLERIFLDNLPGLKKDHLVRNDPPLARSNPPLEVPLQTFSPKTRKRVPEFIIISGLIFVILTNLGLINITSASLNLTNGNTIANNISTPDFTTPTPTVVSVTEETTFELTESSLTAEPSLFPASPLPIVAGTSDESTEENSVIILTVKINDNSKSVNIREDANANSKVVATALDGGTFESLGKIDGWYQIKLEDGSLAFISESCVVENLQ